MTRPVSRSVPSLSPAPVISASPAPAGRWRRCAATWSASGWSTTISKEHLRRVLQSMGITAQRTRTWKWSNDPLFEAKKDWVLAAYKARRGRHPRRGRRVLRRVRADLAEAARRQRLVPARAARPASGPPINRHSGTRKLLGAYDVGADRLWGRRRGPPGHRRRRAGVPPRHPPPLPGRRDRLHRDGQPLRPLDPRHPPMGGRPTTSGCCRPRPTPATSTGSSATSGPSSSSSSTAAT